MKKHFTRPLSLILTCMLGLALSLNAQKGNTEIVIVQKSVDEDGNITIVKKQVYAGDDAKTYLHENKDELVDVYLDDEDNVEHYLVISHEDENGERQEMSFQLDGMHQGHHDQDDQGHYQKYRHKSHGSSGAFMGIYPEDYPLGNGVVLDGIVNYSGAQAAGLRTGDVMIAIDDFELVDGDDLSEALAQHKPGETVMVTYLRDGKTIQTPVNLTSRQSYSTMERDPCQVFIGVNLSGRGPAGQGVRISGIIDNTSAARSELQAGDLMLALDGVPVNSYDDILIERNKHQPGEWFTLTVRRDGQVLDIDAQFNTCEEEEEIEEVIPELREEIIEEVPPVEEIVEMPAIEELDNSLKLIEFKAFPNPTVGKLQIQFRAEAKPAVVRITDISGKVIYQDNLSQFDGLYNQEVNLEGVSPGTLILTITQEGRVLSDKVILLPRA